MLLLLYGSPVPGGILVYIVRYRTTTSHRKPRRCLQTEDERYHQTKFIEHHCWSRSSTVCRH